MLQMASEYRKAIGNNIRCLRKKQGLSQNQLSAQCQVRGFDRLTRSAIGKIEVGQRRIQLEELKLFRELLKTTYDELLNE